jgi:hypothetical protein
LIDRFGWEAAHRESLGDMRRMLAAENVYRAYHWRENYRDENGQPNWAKWAGDNPTANRLLEAAMRAAMGEDNAS